jgi:hypothetical protein
MRRRNGDAEVYLIVDRLGWQVGLGSCVKRRGAFVSERAEREKGFGLRRVDDAVCLSCG